MSSLPCCSTDDVERSALHSSAGYGLRKRSHETRSKMARMARACVDEDDEDYDSDSASKTQVKRPRSHVRTSATRRERARMHKLNNAYDKLRRVVPKINHDESNESLSKIATLRLAIEYISTLENVLNVDEQSDVGKEGNNKNDIDRLDLKHGTSLSPSTNDSAGARTGNDHQSEVQALISKFELEGDAIFLAKLVGSVIEECGWGFGKFHFIFSPLKSA